MYDFELSRFLMKSFAFAHGEIIHHVNYEIFCFTTKCEIKSTHRRSDFTRRRRISHCEAIFHPPVRVDLVEKPTSRNLSVFLVEVRGIEPLSESNLERTSPGAVCYLHSLIPAGTNTLRESVAS